MMYTVGRFKSEWLNDKRGFGHLQSWNPVRDELVQLARTPTKPVQVKWELMLI